MFIYLFIKMSCDNIFFIKHACHSNYFRTNNQQMELSDFWISRQIKIWGKKHEKEQNVNDYI